MERRKAVDLLELAHFAASARVILDSLGVVWEETLKGGHPVPPALSRLGDEYLSILSGALGRICSDLRRAAGEGYPDG